MYRGKRLLGVVIARGGSRGLPKKNVRDVGGKPLVAWSVLAGAESSLLDRCVLSSEDEEIIEAARAHGADVPFRRPIHLASDETSAAAVVIHACAEIPGYDYVVLLQATSPLRTGADIDGCVRHCIDHDAPAAISVCRASKSPYWMFRLDGGRLDPLFPELAGTGRRQELPEAYALNGAVYVVAIDTLRRLETFRPAGTIGYLMSAEHSVDVDALLDAELADVLLRKRPLEPE